MICFSKKITKNYGIELTLFNKIRMFADGLTVFNFYLNIDKYEGDHSPKFEISLTLLNINLFEFIIYYLHHRD